MEKVFEQKLDIYYMATIAYLVTLIIYSVVTGTLIGERFELVWKDPIVYLLALCSLISIMALVIAAVLNKKITVGDSALTFQTRFKERAINAADVEWIRFRSGSRGKVREGVAQRAARMKLKNKRRRLWLRPAMFDEGEELVNALNAWVQRNEVSLHSGKRGKKKSDEEFFDE